jgi:anti-sigma factor RsiW
MIQPEIIRELAAYADGEVDDVLRPQLEQAVAGDPECQAAVARWKALRQCARRALASEPVPGDLQERIRRALAHQRRVKAFRWWGFSGLALASAALIFVVAVRPAARSTVAPPQGRGAVVLVYPADFARIYEHCGYTRHHTLTEVRERSLADVARQVHAWENIDFPVYLPNMAGAGFQLAGVCRCFPRERTGVRVVHANYVRGSFRPNESSPPENVVSFFCLSGRVELAQQEPIFGPGRNYVHPQRHYYVAHPDANVTVVKWDEAQSSVAACSCIPQQELVRLVDSTEVAAVSGQQLAELAEAAPRSGGSGGGAYAGAGLVIGLLALLLHKRLQQRCV